VSTVWLDNHLRLNCGFLAHAVLNSRIVDAFVWGVGAWAGHFDLRLIHAPTDLQSRSQVVLRRFGTYFRCHLVGTSTRERPGVRVDHVGPLGRSHDPIGFFLNFGAIVSVVVSRTRIRPVVLVN